VSDELNDPEQAQAELREGLENAKRLVEETKFLLHGGATVQQDQG
jgi:hypothetical protein